MIYILVIIIINIQVIINMGNLCCIDKEQEQEQDIDTIEKKCLVSSKNEDYIKYCNKYTIDNNYNKIK